MTVEEKQSLVVGTAAFVLFVVGETKRGRIFGQK